MIDVDAEHALEVTAVCDEEPVQTLGSDSSDESLGDRVRFRRSHRRLDDMDPFAGEDRVEVAGELVIAVADQEAEPSRLLLERPGELTGLLGNPGAGRVGGAAGEVHAAACEFDEEEDVEALQRDRLDGEEIDGEHALRLLPQEGTPCEAAATASGAEARFAEDLPHRRCGHA